MAMSAQKIPAEEQQRLTDSFVDPNGRVFEWRGEIYRMIEPAFAARWKDLTKTGPFPRLSATVCWSKAN